MQNSRHAAGDLRFVTQSLCLYAEFLAKAGSFQALFAEICLELRVGGYTCGMRITGLTIFAGLNQVFHQIESVICHFQFSFAVSGNEKDFEGGKMPLLARKRRAGTFKKLPAALCEYRTNPVNNPSAQPDGLQPSERIFNS